MNRPSLSNERELRVFLKAGKGSMSAGYPNTFLPFNEGLGNLYVTELAVSYGQPSRSKQLCAAMSLCIAVFFSPVVMSLRAFLRTS